VTLRARFATLAIVLLAVVLGGATFALERLDARDVSLRLAARARDRARPRPGGPEDGGPPRPPEDEPPASPPLSPEPDGAHLEVFLYEIEPAGPEGPPTLRLRSHRANGPIRFPEARAASIVEKAGLVTRVEPGAPVPVGPDLLVEQGGAEWQAAIDLRPTPPPRRRGPPSREREPRDRPDGPERERPPGPRTSLTLVLLDTAPERARHQEFVLRAAFVAASAVLGGALLAYLFAGRMLRPVARAAAAAERIASPKERLPSATPGDELGRLVGVLNAMLGRLEAASERERRFLANASHELRRPLAALLGELELAAAPGRTPDAMRASIGVAGEDGRGMARLVDDLLEHARAQAGRLPLERRDTDLAEVVASAVERSGRALGRSLPVAVGAMPSRLVHVDPDALRRVVENLVVNAAIHGGEGVRISVSSETDDAEVRLHVDDDGPGIGADEREHVFEPFGRGDRVRSGPGTGLGLAIARSIVEAHGGRLEAVSPRTRDGARPGARFSIHIPAPAVARAS
jgi:signal transduction histidine kinase